MSPGAQALRRRVRSRAGTLRRAVHAVERRPRARRAAARLRGKDARLSGPAGGIVGMALTARSAGIERVIGFDMGGTSTDVSLHAGRFERRAELVAGGVPVAAPALTVDTVAAGGGSICRFAQGAVHRRAGLGGCEPGSPPATAAADR